MICTNEERGGTVPVFQALRRSRAAWRQAALGLLMLAALCNMGQALVYNYQRDQWEQELRQAEHTRDYALEQLGAWEYIGECRITAYCCEPYEHICGTGDGLTATGLPVTPGIAAVDPSVIPLGSTLIIDGQQYLAADTGGAVIGQTVDIAVASHQEAIAFGVQLAQVWLVKEAQQ